MPIRDNFLAVIQFWQIWQNNLLMENFDWVQDITMEYSIVQIYLNKLKSGKKETRITDNKVDL